MLENKRNLNKYNKLRFIAKLIGFERLPFS